MLRAVAWLSLAAAATAQSCVTAMMDVSGAFYTSELLVGTPAQMMHAIPDTGSYDLLLDSEFCQQEACQVHRQYDANSSLTAQNPAAANYSAIFQNTAYGQGSVQSVEWRDSVSFGGLTAPADMLLMIGTQLRNFDIPSDSFDGIMGLSRCSTPPEGRNQTALLSSLGVDHFTMCLGPMHAGQGQPSGARLGGRMEMVEASSRRSPLETAFAASFVSIGITGVNSWSATMSGASVGSASLPGFSAACGGGCAALIDSGTTLLTVPTVMLSAITGAIDTACPGCLDAMEQQETCDGPSFQSMPNITFVLGGQSVSLSPWVYMAPMHVQLQWLVRVGAFTFPVTSTGVRCVPLFSGMDQTTTIGPLVILGMPFLRQYATRFRRQGATTASMDVARLSPSQNAYHCTSCPDDDSASSSRRETLGSRKGSARSAPAALQPAGERAGVLRMESIRLPWYAVDPAMRPSHVAGSAHAKAYNASAVTAMHAGHSSWKLVL